MAQHLHSRVDHTNYRPHATPNDIQELVEEAVTFGFRSVCVNLTYVRSARMHIDALMSNLLLSGIVDFPLGAGGIRTKVHQAMQAKDDGADELDTVVNIGAFFHGDTFTVRDEIRAMQEILPTKFIIEHALLTDDQVLTIAGILAQNGAYCVKLATGFMVADIELKIRHTALIRAHFPSMIIKASGGIQTRDEIVRLVAAGADIIGTSKAHTIFSLANDPASSAQIALQ